MNASQPAPPSGSYSFFAAWMLLHEKADDWLRDAVRRAEETPEQSRHDYQQFLLGVEKEKESLKSIFADAMVHEFRHMGFVHQSDQSSLQTEVDNLRERLAGLEEKLERFQR